MQFSIAYPSPWAIRTMQFYQDIGKMFRKMLFNCFLIFNDFNSYPFKYLIFTFKHNNFCDLTIFTWKIKLPQRSEICIMKTRLITVSQTQHFSSLCILEIIAKQAFIFLVCVTCEIFAL